MVFSRRFAFAILGFAIAIFPTNLTAFTVDKTGILTPTAPAKPHINGPKIYGVRPGHPFLYRIPSTGIRPIQFSAKGLPPSLSLDKGSGIISGRAPAKEGVYAVKLKASNSKGKASRRFQIVVGDKISLTPQMGWNDWYTHYDHVTDKNIRQAADAMVSSGMADYGYQYVDIDDCWANKPGSTDPALNGPLRDSDGAILSNQRFPDMVALTGYIHSKGLKTGIYTSPGPLTCGGFEGSYRHEHDDAQQFAKWGFDLLKYDWCSYGEVAGGDTLEDFQLPYRKMGGILQSQDRDIVFNLCQYGEKNVWKWGSEVGGNSWRTTGDLGLEAATQLPGFYSIGFANADHSGYAGPGGWNDPDYILIGKFGNAHRIHNEHPVQETTLTHDEQYSYMSMWSLMAAPLFFSGDMADLDPFTLNILCNSEVIDIDQDVLGKQGSIVRKTNDEFVLAKPLEEGAVGVGLFNLSSTPRTISIQWSELGVNSHKEKVRDVWRQHALGSFRNGFSAPVPPHGVVLIKVSAK